MSYVRQTFVPVSKTQAFGDFHSPFSTLRVSLRSAYMPRPYVFASDCVGPSAEAAVAGAPEGGVVLLENLRFHPEEERDDPAFAAGLAKLADVYVNDAFGAAHRAHASVEAIVRLVKDAGAGLLMDTELRYLGEAVGNPQRPYVAILGGAKVSDKIEVIDNLIPKVDRLIIGGAMAYTFFKAQGRPVGTSLVEDDKLDAAKEILARAAARGLTISLPVDHVVAPKFEATAPNEAISVNDPAIGSRMGLDIGPKTLDVYRQRVLSAGTVFWNGPMGAFEIPPFAAGTRAVAEAMASSPATTVAGGGDSGAAVVPGNPDKSLLIRAVRQSDKELRMPPKAKLTDAQIAARYAAHPKSPPPPPATLAAPGEILFAERHPGLPMIIDHMSLHHSMAKSGEIPKVIDDVVAFAKYPNVSVKMSSVPNYSLEDYPYRDMDAALKRCFDAFGPRRCHWGTDITNGYARATYKQRVTHFTEELSFLSEEDKDWVMGKAILQRLKWA